MPDPTVSVPPPDRDPAAFARLMQALDAGAGTTRYIGGWVRDTLRGVSAADVDLATRLAPDDVVARLEAADLAYWTTPSGIAHGTVTAMPDGKPVEVTTLRRDVSTDGRRATVAFTEDWREDAARRDFTINALSADPATGAVSDYFGGLDDLAAGRVRFIGDPLVRIAEDHLRILRFFRFHARFGGAEPDAAALDACAERANDLMALSRERIADELIKLLALADPVATVAVMRARGIFVPILPEIDEGSVARLSALVARETAAGIAPDPLRRLAALLPADPEFAVAIAARLKLSNEARKRLAAAADRADWRQGSAFQRAWGIGPLWAIDRLLLGDEPLDRVRALHAELDGATLPRFPLKGGDLIALGLREGPAVAAAMQAVTRDWVEADFPDEAWVRARAAEAVARARRD